MDKSGRSEYGNRTERTLASRIESSTAAIKAWELRKYRKSEVKVCSNPYCEHGGKPQEKSNFHKSAATKGGLAYVCKDCLKLSNTKSLASKEGDEKGEFLISDTRYKIGSHGFVYYYHFGEWVKSTVTKGEIQRNNDCE